MYNRLQGSGRLIREDAWELCTLFDVNFRPERMSVAELEHHFRWLVQELYSEQATAERQQRFRRQLSRVIKNERSKGREVDGES